MPFLHFITMATSNLNGVSQIFAVRPDLVKDRKPNHRPSTILAFTTNPTDDLCQDAQSLQDISSSISSKIPRRASIGLVATLLFNQGGIGASRAEEAGNGLWLTGPLPVPTVANKIANEKTGTRSFLRNGIYMPNVGAKTAYRLKHYAFDLLALGDLLGQDAWSYVRKYLCLKSTVMYYDFDKVITTASDEQKQPLTDLANRLFDSIEKLEEAVKKKNEAMTESCYADATVFLKEVMTRMA